MNREKEIIDYLKSRNIPLDSLEANSIIEGIQWADGHPNLYNDEKYHTVKVSCLDEFLKEACEWLDTNAEDYTIDGGLSIECLIYSFKKAMEDSYGGETINKLKKYYE